MKAPSLRLFTAAILLLPAIASAQSTQPASKPKPGVRSRGVELLAPGQAAAADDLPPVASASTPVAAPAIMPVSAPIAPPASVKPAFVVTPVSHPIFKPCSKPFGAADLTLGAKGFDHGLAAALKTGAPVVIDVGQPYDPASEAPAALSPWLKASKAGGRSVTVSPYCAGGRGIVRDWVADVVAHMSGRIYLPARNYDVILYANAATQRVTQVQFKPKPPLVAAN